MIPTFWIVWNEKCDYLNFPAKKHFSLTDANQEAERLAAKHRGEKFSVLQLKGSVKTLTVQWEFPDDFPF
jgi:hypothetical protein